MRKQTAKQIRGNEMSASGFTEHRTGMWEWQTESCNCEYCMSWVPSLIAHCAYDHTAFGSCEVRHDGITNRITVESWSMGGKP